MALARSQVGQERRELQVPFPESLNSKPFTVTTTHSELNWAFRALKAEVTLSEREKHHSEVKTLLEHIVVSDHSVVIALVLTKSTVRLDGHHRPCCFPFRSRALQIL